MMAFREQPNTAAKASPAQARSLFELLRAGGMEDRAGFFLVLFMRVLAGAWVVQGLWQWGAILLPPEPLFDNVPALHGAAVIFFCGFRSCRGSWLMARNALGRRDLAARSACANLCLPCSAGVLFTGLGRR